MVYSYREAGKVGCYLLFQPCTLNLNSNRHKIRAFKKFKSIFFQQNEAESSCKRSYLIFRENIFESLLLFYHHNQLK